MRAQDRTRARKSIDNRLILLRNIEFSRPPRGWLKAIRDALGMTAEQLASRIGVTRPRVYEMEKSEVSGSITLDSLERAARALDCQLVYALVPRKPLQELVIERANHLAKKRLAYAAHSMALEDQSVDTKSHEAQLEMLTQTLLETKGSALWEDE